MKHEEFQEIFKTLKLSIPETDIDISENNNYIIVITSNIGCFEINMMGNIGYKLNTIWAHGNKIEIHFKKKEGE